MRKHIDYAIHFLRWKWFLFRAGLKTGAPVWRLLIHDLGRLRPSIWRAYAAFLYGPTADAQQWMAAWLRRQGTSVLEADDAQEALALKEYNHAHGKVTVRFHRARLQLLHRSKWSWTWWILRDEMYAQPDALEMPVALIRVQLADWIASVRDQHGKWDMELLRRFYAYRRLNIKLHTKTRKTLERIMAEVRA